MKTRFLQASTALTAAAMLAGCANIQDDQTRTRAEGAGAGAVIGGIAGAIIGNNSGHHSWEGALIGAAAGGAAGLAYGDYVARKKANYASREAWLNACIDEAEKVNDNAVAYNDRLSNQIADLRAKINNAKSRGDKGELRKLKSAVLSLQNETKKQVKVVSGEINAQQQPLKETGSAELNNRIGQLRSTKSSLNQNEEKLAALNNSIDV
jgi:uncharacterized protein YcfJ